LLAKKWLSETESRELKPGSVRVYRQSLDRHILPGLGEVRLSEATVPRIDRFLKSLTVSSGASTAKTARVVLAGMFSLATRHGAIEQNPVRETGNVVVKRDPVTAPTLADIVGIRARFQAWDAGKDKRGKP